MAGRTADPKPFAITPEILDLFAAWRVIIENKCGLKKLTDVQIDWTFETKQEKRKGVGGKPDSIVTVKHDFRPFVVEVTAINEDDEKETLTAKEVDRLMRRIHGSNADDSKTTIAAAG